MLAYILALAVGGSSLFIFTKALLSQEHQKEGNLLQTDIFWGGVGLFYALVLWLCAGRITGAVLLGQIASVSLIGWFGWQTLTLRRSLEITESVDSNITPATEIPETSPEKVTEPIVTEQIVPEEEVSNTNISEDELVTSINESSEPVSEVTQVATEELEDLGDHTFDNVTQTNETTTETIENISPSEEAESNVQLSKEPDLQALQDLQSQPQNQKTDSFLPTNLFNSVSSLFRKQKPETKVNLSDVAQDNFPASEDTETEQISTKSETDIVEELVTEASISLDVTVANEDEVTQVAAEVVEDSVKEVIITEDLTPEDITFDVESEPTESAPTEQVSDIKIEEDKEEYDLQEPNTEVETSENLVLETELAPPAESVNNLESEVSTDFPDSKKP